MNIAKSFEAFTYTSISEIQLPKGTYIVCGEATFYNYTTNVVNSVFIGKDTKTIISYGAYGWGIYRSNVFGIITLTEDTTIKLFAYTNTSNQATPNNFTAQRIN